MLDRIITGLKKLGKKLGNERGLATSTAILLGSAIAGGGSLLGSIFGKPEAPEYGFDVYEPETYKGYEHLQESNVGYLQGLIDDLKKGKRPKYLDEMATSIKDRRQEALDRQYLGTPGVRTGAVNLAQQAGTAGGLGPQQSIANVNKQLYNFNSDTAQIDNYIDELIGGYTQQTALTAPQLVAQQPASNPYQLINYSGGIGGGGGSTVGTGISAAGQAIGSGLSNSALYNSIFGGGNQPISQLGYKGYTGGDFGLFGGQGGAPTGSTTNLNTTLGLPQAGGTSSSPGLFNYQPLSL